MSAVSSARCATRSPLVANRGSSNPVDRVAPDEGGRVSRSAERGGLDTLAALPTRPAEASEHPRERPELLLVADRDDELAIVGVEHGVGRDAGVRVAEPARCIAGGEGGCRLVRQRREQALHEIHLDELPSSGALALAQGEQDAGERVLAREHIDERHARLGGFAVGRARDGHEPADGLHEQVVAGERGTLTRAETRDRAVDGAGIHRAHVLEGEPEPRHDAGPEVLDDHVGRCRQPMRLGEVARRRSGRARRSACCGSRCRSRWPVRSRRPAASSAGCRRRRATRPSRHRRRSRRASSSRRDLRALARSRRRGHRRARPGAPHRAVARAWVIRLRMSAASRPRQFILS